MDLRSHFVAYRTHLSKTALLGGEEYAKIVRTKDNLATAAEYLAYFRDMAKMAAEEMNLSKYSAMLKCHQNGMLSLYAKMVDDDLLGMRQASQESILDMIAFRGWHWMRHIPKVIYCTYNLGPHGKVTAAIVPNFGEAFRSLWKDCDVVLDAEEMAFLSGKEKSGLPLQVILEKKKRPRTKYCEDGTFRSADQNNTISDLVDWALPLGF